MILSVIQGYDGSRLKTVGLIDTHFLADDELLQLQGPSISYRIAVGLNWGKKVLTLQTLATAVAQAAALSEPGDTVLFSPAFASFDMFKNYEHRDQTFIDLVRQLDN